MPAYLSFKEHKLWIDAKFNNVDAWQSVRLAYNFQSCVKYRVWCTCMYYSGYLVCCQTCPCELVLPLSKVSNASKIVTSKTARCRRVRWSKEKLSKIEGKVVWRDFLS